MVIQRTAGPANEAERGWAGDEARVPVGRILAG